MAEITVIFSGMREYRFFQELWLNGDGPWSFWDDHTRNNWAARFIIYTENL